MSDFFTKSQFGTVTQTKREYKNAEGKDFRYDISFEVVCSCGKFARKGVDKGALLYGLDRHMEGHQ